MRHRKKKKVLDRKRAARKALLRGLAVQLIRHERIKTSQAKAKALQAFVEPLVRKAKTRNINTIRSLRAELGNVAAAVQKITTVIGPRYQGRHGGYTRTIPAGRRKGDAAKMALIEFV